MLDQSGHPQGINFYIPDGNVFSGNGLREAGGRGIPPGYPPRHPPGNEKGKTEDTCRSLPSSPRLSHNEYAKQTSGFCLSFCCCRTPTMSDGPEAGRNPPEGDFCFVSKQLEVDTIRLTQVLQTPWFMLCVLHSVLWTPGSWGISPHSQRILP